MAAWRRCLARGKKGRERLTVVGTPLMSVTKEVKRVELLGGVEDTGGVGEEDEGGGVSVEGAMKEEEGTDEEVSKENDVEVREA